MSACAPALSTNMMTLRNGEGGTPSSGTSPAGLTLNHLAASSSKVSTRHGRLESFVLASLHRPCSALAQGSNRGTHRRCVAVDISIAANAC